MLSIATLTEEHVIVYPSPKAADVKMKELEVALCEYQNQPSIAESTACLLEELAWFKTEVSKMYSQLQNLQLEALASSRGKCCIYLVWNIVLCLRRLLHADMENLMFFA